MFGVIGRSASDEGVTRDVARDVDTELGDSPKGQRWRRESRWRTGAVSGPTRNDASHSRRSASKGPSREVDLEKEQDYWKPDDTRA